MSKKISNTKKKTKISQKKGDTFLLDSRLNRTQRKFCSCIMDVRVGIAKSKKRKTSNFDISYPICYKSIKGRYIKDQKFKKIKRRKKRTFEEEIKLKNLNCLFNYDFNKYTLEDLQYLAKSKDIPTRHIKKGKKVDFTKSDLIRKIKNKYFSKRSNKKTVNTKQKTKTK